MKYPKKLQNKGTIGVIAPSAGFTENKFLTMCDNSKERLEKLGYKIIYSESCFKDYNGRSNSSEIRAEEFKKFYLDSNIDIIVSLSGGEYEMEILDNLDLSEIKKYPPKLFCGCSDNTILTFLLTTYCDIATIYGHNFYELGINHEVIDNGINHLTGKNIKIAEIQTVEEKDESWKLTTPQVAYNCNFYNEWKIYSEKAKIDETGILIGGLLENLICICGTKYDKVDKFLEKYKENGFIWYIDICTLSPEEVKRSLWQLKNASWFKYAKLFMIARPINQSDSYGKNYRENMFEELKSLNVPVIFDVNIGHIAPSYSIYNGALARVIKDNNLGTIDYIEY